MDTGASVASSERAREIIAMDMRRFCKVYTVEF